MAKKEPQYGDRDTEKKGPVFQLQSQLAKDGYYKGKVDGDFGPKTLAAVNLVREEKGLEPLPNPDDKPAPVAGAPITTPIAEAPDPHKRITLPEDVAKPVKVNMNTDPTGKSGLKYLN